MASQEENDSGASGVIKVAKDITVIVTLVVGLISRLFLVLPNLKTSTKQRVSIEDIVVETGVTLAMYKQGHYIAGLVSDNTIEFRTDTPPDGTVGTVVRFGIVSEGVRSKTLPMRWSLIAAGSHEPLGESEKLDPVSQPVNTTSRKADLDIGSWEFWVDTSPYEGTRVLVRIEIYDDNQKDRLTVKDTKPFLVKSG